MNKRIFFGFVLMALAVTGTYAADFQVGIGAGGDFGLVFTSFDTNIPEPAKSEAEKLLKNQDTNRSGFWFFLDLTYFEIDLGMKFYNLTMKQIGADLKEIQSYFNIGLMGKYPFSVNDSLSIFPLLGIDFQILTKVKDTQGGDSITIERSDLSDYEIDETYFDRTVCNFGVGVDISITSGLFFRGVIIYGINFHTKQQKDEIDIIKDAGYNVSILDHGPSMKLALGYKF
jgi:hypothetical protein